MNPPDNASTAGLRRSPHVDIPRTRASVTINGFDADTSLEPCLSANDSDPALIRECEWWVEWHYKIQIVRIPMRVDDMLFAVLGDGFAMVRKSYWCCVKVLISLGSLSDHLIDYWLIAYHSNGTCDVTIIVSLREIPKYNAKEFIE